MEISRVTAWRWVQQAVERAAGVGQLALIGALEPTRCDTSLLGICC